MANDYVTLKHTYSCIEARLSRYETAMREALRILGPAGRYRDVEAILRAALSDQPAEEPAGSKCLTIERVTTVLYDHIRSADSCSCGWRADPENHKVYDWQHRIHVAETILDAQPSTPSGEERKR
jgi:hypothetical protein